MLTEKKIEKRLFVQHFIKNRFVWLVLCSSIPISMMQSAMASWFLLYLKENGLFLPMSNNYLISWNICLFLGVIMAGWFSDKLFFGTRWFANIFFQGGLIFLLLIFWLVPGSFIITVYQYLMIGVISFASGSFISIFITLIELIPKKTLGISIGIIILFMYNAYIIFSGTISGIIIEYCGWNYYFLILFIISVSYSLILWLYRPLPMNSRNGG